MSYALISHLEEGSTDGATFTTTSSFSTAGADLLVVCVSAGNISVATLSDSKSNTWLTSPPTLQTGIAPNGQIFYAFATGKTGTAHTFTLTGAAEFGTLSILAFSGGLQASAFDQENGSASSAEPSTFSPGSVTPSEANELVVSALTSDTSITGVSCPNATASFFNNVAGGAHYGGGSAYVIQTAAAAVDMAWNYTGTIAAVTAEVATFKAAVAAGGQPVLSAGFNPAARIR